MQRSRDERPTNIILLAVAINVLVVTLWLVLMSVIPTRIAPGFGL